VRIRAYILSVLLHAAVVLVTVTGLDLWPSDRPQPEQTFTVEFGAVAELEQAAAVQAPLPEDRDVPLPRAKPSEVLAAAPSAPVVDRVTAAPDSSEAVVPPAPPPPTAAAAARQAAQPAAQPAAQADAAEAPRVSAAPEPDAAEADRAEAAEATALQGGAPAEEAAPRAADVAVAPVVSASEAEAAQSARAEEVAEERVAALEPAEQPEERQAPPTPPVPESRPAETVPVVPDAPEAADAPDPEQRPDTQDEPIRAQPRPSPATEVEVAEAESPEATPPEPAPSAAAPRPRPRPRQLEVATAPQPPRPEPPVTEDRPQTAAFDPNRLAALLDRRRDDNPTDVARGERNVTPQESDTVVRQQRDARLGSVPLSTSELAAIRQQFERCWNPPAGARDARNLVVRVRVWLRPDGSLQREPSVVNSGESGDQFWRVAAESAVRAVRRCEPVQGLDPEKYEQWRDIELTFNPRDMLG